MIKNKLCPICQGELKPVQKNDSIDDDVTSVGSGTVYMPPSSAQIYDLNASSCKTGNEKRKKPLKYQCKKCGERVDIFTKPL